MEVYDKELGAECTRNVTSAIRDSVVVSLGRLLATSSAR